MKYFCEEFLDEKGAPLPVSEAAEKCESGDCQHCSYAKCLTGETWHDRNH